MSIYEISRRRIGSSSLRRGEVWALVCLILSVMTCRTSQQNIGYTNITFAARPMESYYTVTNRATTMYCRAQGVSTVTGKIVELDIVFTRNGEPIDIYDTPSRHYYLNDNGFTSTGLTIYPTELEDDQSVYRCQVYVNSKPYDMYTDNITLTVADGRPPAIPLTVTHSNVHSVTVQWSTVLVPPGGDIQHYLAKLYSESDSLISSTQVNNINALSHTFGGLLSNTNYKVRIIGVNKYGSGNETTLLPVRTVISQKAPAPSSISVTTLSGTGNIRVSWEAPVITNYETTSPITHYIVQYQLNTVGSTSHTVSTPNNATLQIEINGLTVGATYIIKVFSVNTPNGNHNFITKTVQIMSFSSGTVPSTLSQTSTVVSSATPTTSFIGTQTTLTKSSVIATPTTSSIIGTQTTPTSSSIIGIQTTYTTSSSSSSAYHSTPTTSSTHQTTPTHTSTSTSSLTKLPLSSSTPTIVIKSTSSTAIKSTPTTTTISANPTNNLGVEGDTLGNSLVLILASAVIAGVIIVAIVIVSVILIAFCVYTTKRKDDVDLTDGPTTWPERPPSAVKKWGSKESSIKGSGSISSDQEPHSYPGVAINHNYSSIPSDSPSSRKSDHDLGSIEELQEIEVDVEPEPETPV